MDVRFWIMVCPMWFVALAILLVSLMPVVRWAHMRYWRVLRISQPVLAILMATFVTLSIFWLEHRSVFGLTPEILTFAGFALSGLTLLVAAVSLFLLKVRRPEVATVLHIPPRLYAWLYERDINESSQPAPSPQPLPGDDR